MPLSKLSDKRILLVFVLALFLTVALVLSKSDLVAYRRIKTFEFRGGSEAVMGTVVVMKGNYFSADHPELTEPDQVTTIKFKMESDTKIIRTTIDLSLAKVAENGRLILDETKEIKTGVDQETLLGDLRDSALYIVVKSKRNIYKKSLFTASEIEYKKTVQNIKSSPNSAPL